MARGANAEPRVYETWQKREDGRTRHVYAAATNKTKALEMFKARIGGKGWSQSHSIVWKARCGLRFAAGTFVYGPWDEAFDWDELGELSLA